MSDSPLLTVEEVAVFLRVPKSWVYEQTRQVGADAIPCYEAGKALLFDPAEVIAWFKRTRKREAPRVRRTHSSRRPRRILTTSPQAAPKHQSGGQGGQRPHGARVSAAAGAPVASALPSDGTEAVP